MVSTVCYAEDDSKRLYDYCPSFAATVLFAILFGAVTITHIVQAFRYRKPFTWVLIMAGGWELGGYIARTLSVMDQLNSGIFTAQFLLILLAPLWINAFVYMVLGRMIHFFLEDDRIFGIRARRITLMFVLFDIAAFVVQLTGGMMASGDDYSAQTIQNGLHIYTGGVGLQLAFIAVFIALALRFQRILKRQDQDQASQMVMEMSRTQYEPTSGNEASTHISLLNRSYRQARPLLIIIWVALGFIVLRNVYRLIEYGMGGVNGNTITRHEWFQYVLVKPSSKEDHR